jgi:REP element-mobilizing transposase RayT
MCWRHVVISTHNSWLPGDPRGFRTRHHKIHSSGDYRHLPPPGEHAGLHRYSKQICEEPIIIPWEMRAAAGRAIVRKLHKMEYRILAASVAGMHSHTLVELPEDIRAVRRIVGQCKSVASHAIRETLPGRVWGYGGSFTRVKDKRHQKNVFQYILDQEDAWTWSYRDGFPE